MKNFTLFLILFVLTSHLQAQNEATFEELSTGTSGYWNGADGTGLFTSGPFTFYNDYNAEWASWSGFAYSNLTDSVTPGWANQYSAIAGSGAGGSENYAIGFVVGTTKIGLAKPDSVTGMYVTNNTYAYLSMRDGDDYAKKFGGPTGDDPDYFRLIIHGVAESGDTTGTVTFYLADFRSENNSEDYIVKDWKWVDLKPMGAVSELHFSLESSDMGDWGINTPTYFCIDNINRFDISTFVRNNHTISQQINVFPNPFKNSFRINLPAGNWVTELWDMRGNLIISKNENISGTFTMNGLEGLPDGIYLLTLKNGDGNRFSTKIQKINY